MTTPAVSIVMPCHNAVHTLNRSLDSVRHQSFADWELIAIDDGSTDDTRKALQTAAAADPRIRVLHHANCGVSLSRNRGIAAARAPLIAFLDADDEWHADFLTQMREALDRHPQAVLAYCGWRNVGLAGPRGQPFVPPDYQADPSKASRLFENCRWPIHAALSRTDAIRAAGGFATDLTNAEDYLLWLTVAAERPIVRVPQVLSHYHFHGDTQASAQRGTAARQLLDAKRRYLRRQPRWMADLAPARRRQLLYQPLHTAAFDAYWHGDLGTARTLFPTLMRAGYGRLSDWPHYLPALLPARAHQWLLDRLRTPTVQE